MRLRSTICALATPPGEGGIAVVRLSGPDAYAIGAKVFVPIHKGKSVLNARGYTALFGHYLLDGQEMDETVALFYRAPHSYTGEDVIELSVHGGSAMADGLQQALIAAGAVPAAPGEFTRRALENGRMSPDPGRGGDGDYLGGKPAGSSAGQAGAGRASGPGGGGHPQNPAIAGGASDRLD